MSEIQRLNRRRGNILRLEYNKRVWSSPYPSFYTYSTTLCYRWFYRYGGD